MKDRNEENSDKDHREWQSELILQPYEPAANHEGNESWSPQNTVGGALGRHDGQRNAQCITTIGSDKIILSRCLLSRQVKTHRHQS